MLFSLLDEGSTCCRGTYPVWFTAESSLEVSELIVASSLAISRHLSHQLLGCSLAFVFLLCAALLVYLSCVDHEGEFGGGGGCGGVGVGDDGRVCVIDEPERVVSARDPFDRAYALRVCAHVRDLLGQRRQSCLCSVAEHGMEI